MFEFISPILARAYGYENRKRIIQLFLEDMQDDKVFSNPNVLGPRIYFLQQELAAAYVLASESPSAERRVKLAELNELESRIDEQKSRLAKILGFLFL